MREKDLAKREACLLTLVWYQDSSSSNSNTGASSEGRKASGRQRTDSGASGRRRKQQVLEAADPSQRAQLLRCFRRLVDEATGGPSSMSEGGLDGMVQHQHAGRTRAATSAATLQRTARSRTFESEGAAHGLTRMNRAVSTGELGSVRNSSKKKGSPSAGKNMRNLTKYLAETVAR